MRMRRIKRTGMAVSMRVVARAIMYTRRRMKVYMHAVVEKYAVMYAVKQVVRRLNVRVKGMNYAVQRVQLST